MEGGRLSPAIWLVRHAKAVASGVCYGQSDVAVEATPELAAEQILVQAPDLHPTEVWCSPWQRTLPLAEILGARFRAQVRIDPRLAELHFGEWEGLAYSAIERDDPTRFHAWMADWQRAAPPGGEPLSNLQARVAEWLCEQTNAPQRDAGPPRVMVVVTHAGVIRCLRAHSRRISIEAAWAEPVLHLKPERLPI